MRRFGPGFPPGCSRAGPRPAGAPGQTMVEFTLIVPLLLTLLLGTLDLGRGVSAYIALTDVAREAAHYAALQNVESCSSAPNDPAASVCAGVSSHALALAAQVSPQQVTTFSIQRGGGTNAATDTQYTEWQVTMTYRFQPVSSIILGGLAIPISVNASAIAQ